MTDTKDLKSEKDETSDVNPEKGLTDIMNKISTTLNNDAKENLTTVLARLHKLGCLSKRTDTPPTKTSSLLPFDDNQKYETSAMSLQYDIEMKRVLRGYKVTIGCEELLFHDHEYNHMVDVLCTYIINPEPLHDIVRSASRYGSFEDVTSNEEPPCCTFSKGKNGLVVKRGRKGYSLAIGNQRMCYVSTSCELAKEVYNVLTGKYAT